VDGPGLRARFGYAVLAPYGVAAVVGLAAVTCAKPAGVSRRSHVDSQGSGHGRLGGARLVTITAAGGAIVERYLDVILGWFSEAMSSWSDKDLRDLVRAG
jgi:hypothetical protein